MAKTSSSYKTHDDIAVRCMPAHIKEATCQSITRCTLALMGQETLGVEVQVAYDRKTGNVCMIWEKGGRYFNGIIEPVQRAVQVLLVTDTAKRELVGVCPADGIPLRVTKIRSRQRQILTPEQATAKKARRDELARLRAEGKIPPPKPRATWERGITRMAPSRMGRAYIASE